MDAAARAGADTVKTQIVLADEILHPRTGSVSLPGGSVDLYSRFSMLERDIVFYRRLSEACESAGVTFLASVFGSTGAQMLRRLDPREIKIASPELSHIPLLREIATYGVPVLLSTGVSTLADIHEALTALESADSVTLLHCVTAYPAPPEQYNLRVVSSLRGTLGVPVGVSDHSLDAELVPMLATLQGAAVIEKHLTLSNAADGLDDPVALTPDRFALLVRSVHAAAESLPAGRDRILDEITVRYGKDTVKAVLGDGIKRVAACERGNYGRTNRSIHALVDIEAGATISKENCAILRTEKELQPGLHPRYWDQIMGCRVTSPAGAGDGITWHHLLTRR